MAVGVVEDRTIGADHAKGKGIDVQHRARVAAGKHLRRTLSELAAARMGVDVALAGCRQLRVEHGPRTIHR